MPNPTTFYITISVAPSPPYTPRYPNPAYTSTCGYACSNGFHEKGECWRSPADDFSDDGTWQFIGDDADSLFEIVCGP